MNFCVEVRVVFLNSGNSCFQFPLFLLMQTVLKPNFVTWNLENELQPSVKMYIKFWFNSCKNGVFFFFFFLVVMK